MRHVLTRIDEYQRRRPWAGFPLAVVYKFFDDQGGYLSALVTYYAFLALFPLLLLFTTILGYALSGSTDLQHDALHSVLSQFPVIGDQLAHNVHGLQGSLAALLIGALGSVYGALGLAQALQNSMNKVWAVPRNHRRNPFAARLRSLLWLSAAGLAVVASSSLTGITSAGIGSHILSSAGIRVIAAIVAIAINAAALAFTFRFLAARELTTAQVWPGGVIAAISWQVLQQVGSYYVRHKLNGASTAYGVFGVVLGLLAWLYLASVITILCAEINSVRTMRIWPRSLLTPFTDNVSLTNADESAYKHYAQTEQFKGFETVDVHFQNKRIRRDH